MRIKAQDSKRKLRVCARCEFIYWGMRGCPKCEFAHYDAVWVYDGWLRALWYWITQIKYRNRGE